MPAPSTITATGSGPVEPIGKVSVLSSDLWPTGTSAASESAQAGHDDSLLIEALVEVQRGRLALDELMEAGISAQWAA
ncbi:MAG TPA: hypothetical protein VF848_11990 [Steroidobacteraceae bacterium]